MRITLPKMGPDATHIQCSGKRELHIINKSGRRLSKLIKSACCEIAEIALAAHRKIEGNSDEQHYRAAIEVAKRAFDYLDFIADAVVLQGNMIRGKTKSFVTFTNNHHIALLLSDDAYYCVDISATQLAWANPKHRNIEALVTVAAPDKMALIKALTDVYGTDQWQTWTSIRQVVFI